MSLVACQDCGREISSRAPVCPHCGAPAAGAMIATRKVHGAGEGLFMKGMNCGCVLLLVIVGGVVLLIAIGSNTTP